ncbi:hypothetical protein HYW55_06510 [Candidatus Gottesmanbacteria bacterium]|nr:hypothetical protein [Candidatus Gottesmanbacteria bacterium]
MKKNGKSSAMQSVGDILTKFNPLEDKYISREFQAYGYYLAESLNDLKHRGIYMKLAKTMPRALLEKALSYVKDAKVKRKGALFMWKLKELGAWPKKEKVEQKRKKMKDIPF